MNYSIHQQVKIVDLNEEPLQEVIFDHGEIEAAGVTLGCSFVTTALGLKEFEVVYDKRHGNTQRCKIIDIEFSLVDSPMVARVYLEPVVLIIGQHDVGSV